MFGFEERFETKSLVSNLYSIPNIWCRPTVPHQMFRFERAHSICEHVRVERFGFEPLFDTKHLVSNTGSRPNLWYRAFARDRIFWCRSFGRDRRDLVSNSCRIPNVWARIGGPFSMLVFCCKVGHYKGSWGDPSPNSRGQSASVLL